MPLPMVHLAVVVQAHALACHPLTPEFLLGCLAPDAIHMRVHSNLEDKVRVHLRVSEVSELEALAHVRILIDENRPSDPFVAGYAAHLLTDHWWRREVIEPFAAQLPPGTTREERRAWYYQETDQIDFDLYHREPWRENVWALLTAASAPNFAPYLTADEIHRWRVRTLDWFENLKQEPGIVPKAITGGVVDAFIEDSARRILTHLFQ